MGFCLLEREVVQLLEGEWIGFPLEVCRLGLPSCLTHVVYAGQGWTSAVTIPQSWGLASLGWNAGCEAEGVSRTVV